MAVVAVHRRLPAQCIGAIDTAFSKKPKFTINADTRNAFITNGRVKFFGVKMGLDYGKTIKFGAGYHFLETPLYRDDTLRLNVEYGALYGEYIFLKSKRWEFSLPVQIGGGNSSYEYSESDGTKREIHKKVIILYEPSLSAQYKFFRWLGVGMGMGYRIMLRNNKEIKEKMTSPIYVFQLKVFFSELYRVVFPKRRKKA